MLPNEKLARDFASIGYIIQEVLHTTDGRYRQDLQHMSDAVHTISHKLKTESDYAKRLAGFKARGFKVRKLLEQPYMDATRAQLALANGIRTLEELSKIIQEYESKKSQISPDAQAKFEAIMKDPEEIATVTSMWHKLNSK